MRVYADFGNVEHTVHSRNGLIDRFYHGLYNDLGFAALGHAHTTTRYIVSYLGIFVMVMTFLFLGMTLVHLTRRRYGARP